MIVAAEGFTDLTSLNTAIRFSVGMLLGRYSCVETLGWSDTLTCARPDVDLTSAPDLVIRSNGVAPELDVNRLCD